MVMGYSLFGTNNEVVGGLQQLRTRQLATASFTLSTANQDYQDIEIPQLGDLVGIKLSVTATATGTLTGANKLISVLRDVSLRDKTGEPITQGISGGDLNYLLYVSNNSGKKLTETTISSSSATDTYNLQLSVDKTDLPAKLRIGANPYSAAATSGATGGTLSVDIEVFYRDEAVSSTQRVYKQTTSLVSGTNEIGQVLNRQRVIHKVGLGFSESSLTSVLISADGSEQLNMKTSGLTSFMEGARADARISDKLLIPCTPFLATDRSRLQIVTSGSANADIYQFLIDSPRN